MKRSIQSIPTNESSAAPLTLADSFETMGAAVVNYAFKVKYNGEQAVWNKKFKSDAQDAEQQAADQQAIHTPAPTHDIITELTQHRFLTSKQADLARQIVSRYRENHHKTVFLTSSVATGKTRTTVIAVLHYLMNTDEQYMDKPNSICMIEPDDIIDSIAIELNRITQAINQFCPYFNNQPIASIAFKKQIPTCELITRRHKVVIMAESILTQNKITIGKKYITVPSMLSDITHAMDLIDKKLKVEDRLFKNKKRVETDFYNPTYTWRNSLNRLMQIITHDILNSLLKNPGVAKKFLLYWEALKTIIVESSKKIETIARQNTSVTILQFYDAFIKKVKDTLAHDISQHYSEEETNKITQKTNRFFYLIELCTNKQLLPFIIESNICSACIIDEAHTLALTYSSDKTYLSFNKKGYAQKSFVQYLHRKNNNRDKQTLSLYMSATPQARLYKSIMAKHLMIPPPQNKYAIETNLNVPNPGTVLIENPIWITTLHENILMNAVQNIKDTFDFSGALPFIPETYHLNLNWTMNNYYHFNFDELCNMLLQKNARLNSRVAKHMLTLKNIITLLKKHIHYTNKRINGLSTHMRTIFRTIFNLFFYRTHGKKELQKAITNSIKKLEKSKYISISEPAAFKSALIIEISSVPHHHNTAYLRSISKQSIADMVSETFAYSYMRELYSGPMLLLTKATFEAIQLSLNDIEALIKDVMQQEIALQAQSSANTIIGSTPQANNDSRLHYGTLLSVQEVMNRHSENNLQLKTELKRLLNSFCTTKGIRYANHSYWSGNRIRHPLHVANENPNHINQQFLLIIQRFTVNLVNYVARLSLLSRKIQLDQTQLMIKEFKGKTMTTLQPYFNEATLTGLIKILIQSNYLCLIGNKWKSIKNLERFLLRAKLKSHAPAAFPTALILQQLIHISNEIRQHNHCHPRLNSFHDHQHSPFSRDHDHRLDNTEGSRTFPAKIQFLRNIIDILRSKGPTIIFTSNKCYRYQRIMTYLQNGHLYRNNRNEIHFILTQAFTPRTLTTEVFSQILSFIDHAEVQNPKQFQPVKDLSRIQKRDLEKKIRTASPADTFLINKDQLVNGTNMLGNFNIILFEFSEKIDSDRIQVYGRLGRSAKSYRVGGTTFNSSGVLIDLRYEIDYFNLLNFTAKPAQITITPVNLKRPALHSSAQSQANSVRRSNKILFSLLTPTWKIKKSTSSQEDQFHLLKDVFTILGPLLKNYSLPVQQRKNLIFTLLGLQYNFQSNFFIRDFMKKRRLFFNVTSSCRRIEKRRLLKNILPARINTPHLFFGDEVVRQLGTESPEIDLERERAIQNCYRTLNVSRLRLYGNRRTITYAEINEQGQNQPFGLNYKHNLSTNTFTLIDPTTIACPDPQVALTSLIKVFDNTL